MTSDQAALANHSRSSLYEALDMQEEKQKESESIHISSVVVGLAYTGIWNAGLVAAALQPENNLMSAAIGAPGLLLTGCLVRDWCKTRRDAKEPEPIGKAVTTAARHMGETWSKLSLAALGAAAIASTMFAAHVASPDYDYAQLKSSTSLTRLAEPGVSNKILESFNMQGIANNINSRGSTTPLASAETTIKDLSSSTRGIALERTEILKQASIDYLRAALANKDGPAYKSVFQKSESQTIANSPYLKEILPDSVKTEFATEALANISAIQVRSMGKRKVSGELKNSYTYSLIQLCRYANNPETKEAVNQNWLAMGLVAIPASCLDTSC